MINKELREEIARLAEDLEEEIVLFDNPSFDNSIIGISGNRLVYNRRAMIEELMEEDGISDIEAEDFIEYNTERSLAYTENAPIIVDEIYW